MERKAHDETLWTRESKRKQEKARERKRKQEQKKQARESKRRKARQSKIMQEKIAHGMTTSKFLRNEEACNNGHGTLSNAYHCTFHSTQQLCANATNENI